MTTLLDRLARQAERQPDLTAFEFEGESCSYSHLWASAAGVASGLVAAGVTPGERVVMALPNGPDFFTAFYGILRAGGVAVPIHPESGADRVRGIARSCRSRLVVASSPDRESAATTVGELGREPAEADLPEVGPGDLAYVQYTSGSTGNPKGVQISHANVVANIGQLIGGMEITRDEVFVSWLPIFHDMGLVLMTMVPFWLGARLHLLPANLRQVRGWAEAIERHRGSFTAAPDFAYRLLLRRVEDRGDYDLSSLRVALNAAEPVRHDTLRGFERVFGLSNIMMPAYGLAEATVGVSMWPAGTEVRVDAGGFVSAGRPFPDVEVGILGERGLLAAGETGEIVVRSPGNTRGYLDNPDETERLFWEESYIRTGDLGHLDADGYLYVVGRKKNIIIHAGRNIAPREVEEAVDPLPFVRFSAAVGIDRGGMEGEQIYVFAELRSAAERLESELQRQAVRIVQAIHSRLGIRPGRVYLVEPHTIPMTGTGKIRYPRLRELYASGELRERGRLIFPGF